MDKLDKYAAIAIILLITISTVLIFYQINSVEAGSDVIMQREQTAPDPQLKKKVNIASELIANSNLDKADALIVELVAQFPYEGSPYMMLGDLRIRQQAPIKAMLAYKEAVGLNPDYLDKKTPDFQGKKIKNTVREARNLIEVALKKNSGDKEFQAYRKTVYYMLRKIAGSCG